MESDAVMGLGVALPFVWLGMVLAISFIEAPLKFRAPGITVALGVGIGRLVFRALNAVEAVFAVALIALVLIGGGTPVTVGVLSALCVGLAVQAAVLRPLLDRRATAGVQRSGMPRTMLHGAYIALEVLKIPLLVALGVLMLGVRS